MVEPMLPPRPNWPAGFHCQNQPIDLSRSILLPADFDSQNSTDPGRPADSSSIAKWYFRLEK
jgi:hypothetical protein